MFKWVAFLFVAAFCGLTISGAWAGTAYVDFSAGTGPLNVRLGGSGSLTSSGGRAVFTGPNLTVVGQSGSAVSCGGTLSNTMTLKPSTDAVNGVGLAIIDASDPQSMITATVDSDGNVVLADWIGNYQTGHFTYPAAGNNYMTLQYNSSTERATLTLNGSQTIFLEAALNGATNVYLGVFANGAGGFANFAGQGPCIPDYPPQVVDSDDDGVSDDEETSYGSNPEDPGHLPVFQAEGAAIHALNGAEVTIEAGSLPQNVVVVKVGTPGTIPAGTIPGDKHTSAAALSLGPDGAIFSIPVQVSLPYTPAAITGLQESSLTAVYFNGTNYAADGIADVSVDPVAHVISFSTTHFTDFLVAGDYSDADGDGVPDLDDAFPYNPLGATDSDGDGLGDEWEERWFGDNNGVVEPGELDAANAYTDYDFDGISDRREFEFYSFGLDPTDGASRLPVTSCAGMALLAAAFAGAAWRHLSRSSMQRAKP